MKIQAWFRQRFGFCLRKSRTAVASGNDWEASSQLGIEYQPPPYEDEPYGAGSLVQGVAYEDHSQRAR